MATRMDDGMIDIARDFSRSPAGRFISDGPNSGERFRRDFLVPGMSKHERLVINLDGTRGIGSSFLEEAFGGLMRLGYQASDLMRKFVFQTKDPSLESEIRSYWN